MENCVDSLFYPESPAGGWGILSSRLEKGQQKILFPQYERQLCRYSRLKCVGGIIGCYLESGLPVYYINQNMLDYLGHEYGEFEKATGNLIVNCIDPGDWAQMEHIIDTAMKENKEYAVRYRMRKRNGSYIWGSDIGKKPGMRRGFLSVSG